MNFEFSEEQKFVQQTARDYLAQHSDLAVCRAIFESSSPYEKNLWSGVAEMGWLGAAIPEKYGGAGLGYLELSLIAEEIGRALAPIPFASSVYLATEALLLAGNEEQMERTMPRLASGELIGTFAFSEGIGDLDMEGPQVRFEGDRITGVKMPVLDGDIAGFGVVLVADGSGTSLALVNLDGEGVKRRRLDSLDPSRQLARIEFDGAPAERLGSPGLGAKLTACVLDRAAVLLAFEQIGGAERVFEMTREFAKGRYAFGRPIASFQALKHRLADLYCSMEIARSNAYYGAWALENDDSELPIGACLSRVSASAVFNLASKESIQIHGGVGFTWEYDCHLFYRRAKFNSTLLGSSFYWRELLMQRLENRHLD